MKSTIDFLKNLFPTDCHNRVLIVGGTVRDILLGKEGKDIDLVTELHPATLVDIGFRLVKASSGADIYFHHHADHGKIEVTCIASLANLEKDLRNRDFTINAMAMDLAGNHIDPLRGKADLGAGTLRACSEHALELDPLRIFRAFRFEADGWEMSAETIQLVMQNDWSENFSRMPVERFSGEMQKALAGQKPERFFQRMIELNTGAEFLPELFKMPLIPAGPLEHHPEGDLFTHSVQVLQRVAENSADPLARFCAMFHDLGKLATDPVQYPRHHDHDNAGFDMAAIFCNRLCLPAAWRKALAWVSRLHGNANKWGELRDTTKIRMADHAVKAGIVVVLPLVSGADKQESSLPYSWMHAVRVSMMNCVELGIAKERLETMPVGNRPAFILQKKVEMMRSMTKTSHSEGD